MSFTYRGTTSDSMFFNVTERQVYNAPAFDVNAIEVPGRSGDVLNSQQRFKNKTLVYTGFIRSSDFPGNTQWERLSRGLRNIKAWICGDAGKYHDLTDDYDPGYVRRAFVSGETAINILFDRPDGATITITFLAEPFMYEVSEPIEVPESDTASGSIATFEGVDAPLKSLKFSIAPSQDLHGYSYPWPAGGGVNKLPSPAATSKTVNGITIAVDNGVYSISGTATAQAEIIFDLPSTVTYDTQWKTAFLNDAINSGVVFYYRNDNTNGTSMGFSNSINRVLEHSYEQSANKIRFLIASGTAISGTLHTSPMLMLRTEPNPTSFYPYSNVSPISGWTQVDGKQSGVNMLTKVLPNALSLVNNYAKVISGAGTTAVFYAKAGQTYRVSGATGRNRSLIAYYDADPVVDSLSNSVYQSPTQDTADGYIFTAQQSAYCACYLANSVLSDVNIQVETGSTATTYAAPTLTPITISLGQTVYGGTVDALAGKCYARPYYASYSGEALVGPWISSHDKYVAGETPTTGAQVVDMGGTETTLSLTPVSVNSLLGQNNIWCNTGETEVGYIVPTENPTQWPSQPRLEITMSGAGTLTVNGKTWSIGAYTGTLICDSEIMDWYDAGALKNSLVSGDGFPELVPGDNVITYTGGITKVVATPRWRTL